MATNCVLAAACLASVFAGFAPPAQADDSSLRGIVRAVREAAISTDLNLQILSLPVKEGQPFKQGDVLAQFNCREMNAELAAAAAQLKAETLTLENDQRLAKLNAVGKFDTALQAVKVEQVTAERQALSSKVSGCTIRAPYDGRMVERFANEFEFPIPGKPLMRIVGLSDLDIELILPATWLRWLRVGAAFDLHVEETGGNHAASVVRITPEVDAVSQTVKVIGQFSDPTPDILPGMSGPATFQVPND
jgi:RND family efflux transporter MFP subunit